MSKLQRVFVSHLIALLINWVVFSKQVVCMLLYVRTDSKIITGKNSKMAPKVQPNVSLTFLPNLDVFSYLFLNSRTEILKLFTLYHVEAKSFGW